MMQFKLSEYLDLVALAWNLQIEKAAITYFTKCFHRRQPVDCPAARREMLIAGAIVIGNVRCNKMRPALADSRGNIHGNQGF